MKLYINPLLNKVSNKLNDESITVDKKTFWNYYIKLVILPKGYKLNAMEIDILSTILSSDLNKSLFKGNSRKELESTYSRVRVSQIMKSLKEKGFIVQQSDNRGDYLLADKFKKFAEIINSKEDINIQFCFNFNLL